jgi:protein ImuA
MSFSSPATYRHDLVSVEALRTRIAALEGGWQGAVASGARSRAAAFGLAPLDGALPWGGLPIGCLHEIAASGAADGAALGFAAIALARLVAAEGPRPRPVFWCAAGDGLYGPGLAGYGLDPRRLILVRGRCQGDLLWAMEEALRSGAVAAVLGEIYDLDLTAGRRLQLAAETGGATALLLRLPSKAGGARPLAGTGAGGGTAGPSPSAAVTAWRIAAAPSAPASFAIGLGAERWQVSLARCRGGVPREWLLEWNDEAHRLVVAAELRDGPARPQPGLYRLAV